MLHPLEAAVRRCRHRLEGGKWVPTPGEGGTSGRGGRNVDISIARRALGIMAGAEGRAMTKREERNLARLDRLALRRQAQGGRPAKAAAPEAPKRRDLGPAYDKAGRYYPARDPAVRSVALVRSEVRAKRKSERSRRKKG
jgi:hypothetical protein